MVQNKQYKKHPLKQDLLRKDRELKNKISLLGMTSLTYSNYINAMRSTMNTSHLNQFLVMKKPNFPHLFTNAENTVGKYSSGYKMTKNKCEVYRKIVKYLDLKGSIVDEPTQYLLFYFDKKEETFKVEVRKSGESLVEKFGFDYNNEVIDSLEEGDTIPKGTVLYKSTSYDEDMSYGYGLDAITIYSLDPYTSEDSAIISKSFSKRSAVTMYETFSMGLNGNDFLLNMYGDKNNYLPLPRIGQEVNGFITKIRRKYNDQILFDFSESSLEEQHAGDLVYYTDPGSQIVDYTIYNNNEELVDNTFTKQINTLIRSQQRYYSEILECCEEIMNSGYKYHRDIEYFYKRAIEVLDNKKKWKEGDSAFSNVVIEVEIRRTSNTTKGCKIVGRYGNKSVVSEVRDDEDMPITEDGRRVDVILPLLGIINRTTSEPLYELLINHIGFQATQHMKTLATYEEREDLMFSVIKDINEKQYKKMYKTYMKCSKEKRKEIIDELMEGDITGNGFYLNQDNIDETKPIFYRLLEMTKKYKWIKPVKCKVKKWERYINILNNYIIGTMYILRLKQDDKRGFSARGTGSVDLKSLPVRSYKSKSHLDPFSDTAIRFGEMENFMLLIGVKPVDVALFQALYRTSYKGRKDAFELSFSDRDEEFEITSKEYTSIVAEIFNVIAKTLSFGINFIDEDDEIYPINDDKIVMHQINGRIYHCTDFEFYLIERVYDICDEILTEIPFIDERLLFEKVEEELHKRKYLMGNENDYERIAQIERDIIFTKAKDAEDNYLDQEEAINYFDIDRIVEEQRSQSTIH